MTRFIYILPILALLIACTKDNEVQPTPEVVEPVASDMPMSFDAGFGQQYNTSSRGTLIGMTNATSPNDDDGQQSWTKPWKTGDKFSTYALYYFDTMTTLGQQFMQNQDVTSGATSWSYSPVKYWPQTGYLDFYAHYPSTGNLSSTPNNNRINSLRYWHESPLDTVLTFRYYTLPAAKTAPTPNDMDNPIEDKPVTDVFDDAKSQPDLMFAHHPHLAKPVVNSKVDFSFTHAMMGVRFWIRGLDGQTTDNPSSLYSWFRNVKDFEIKSVSFGPVYTGGEVIAFDNTNWSKYYDGLDEATNISTEPVKLRYLWNFGSKTATLHDGTSTDMTTPAYGGYRQKYDKAPGTPLWSTDYVHAPIDKGYDIDTKASTFSQTCNYSLKKKYPWDTDKSNDDNNAANAFPDEKSETKWIPAKSFPILPVMETSRGVDAKQSAFIFPPQFFDKDIRYIRVTFTMTDDDGSTLTHTLDAPISMSHTDAWWDDARGMLRVEDGEILDIYFTFAIDGDEYFKFLVDAQVNPWVQGGEQKQEWNNW